MCDSKYQRLLITQCPVCQSVHQSGIIHLTLKRHRCLVIAAGFCATKWQNIGVRVLLTETMLSADLFSSKCGNKIQGLKLNSDKLPPES